MCAPLGAWQSWGGAVGTSYPRALAAPYREDAIWQAVGGTDTCVLSSYCWDLADVRAAREQINIGALAYPQLPLHEATPRGPSGYSQPPSVCSSSTSFNGPFAGGVVSPQPHSSYYSGMTGPQHPFYNRVSGWPCCMAHDFSQEGCIWLLLQIVYLALK